MNSEPLSPRDQEAKTRLEILSDLLDEFRARAVSGAPITAEEFVDEHAEFGEELRQLLPVAHALAGLSGNELSSSAAARRDFHSPKGTLGDFRLLREIGRGGMGIVYEAEQVSLGRRVALKVFPFATLLDSRQLERFKTEARTAAMLQHRHIVNVLSVGCERGVHFYAMELIDGHSLAKIIDQLSEGRNKGASTLRDQTDAADRSSDEAWPVDDTRPIAALSTQYSHDRLDYFRRIARLGIQVAEALQYAHAQGVLHRDVKPSNLLLDPEGNVHITDFGLARIGEGGGITASGDLVGTLRYMSPEQLELNRTVDFRADIYAIGATLYELLAARPLFEAKDRTQLLSQILGAQPMPLRQIDRRIPPDLETIVHKCVARFPADRYATAADVAEDLQRFCDHRPISATPTRTMQSIRQWIRRNRRLSTAIAVASCALLTLAVVGPLAALRQGELLDDQKALTAQVEGEKEALRRERRRGEQQLYDSLVRVALTETEQGSFRRAAEVVQRYLTSEMTSFEFSLLRNRLDSDRNRTLAKHWCNIQQIAIHPDAPLLAYGTWNGTVVVLDIQSRDELYRFDLTDGRIGWIEALEFSPDGQFLFCGAADALQMRRVADWALIPFPSRKPDDASIRVVQSASFGAVHRGSDSKTLLAVGDRSGYNVDNEPAHLLVYEINEANGAVELRHAGTLDGIRGAVNDIAFEKDRNVLLACGRGSLIRRWQLPSLAPLEPIDVGAMNNSADGVVSIGDIEPHPKQPDVVFFSITTRLVDHATSRVGVVSLEEGTSQLIATRPVSSRSLAISPHGDRLAVGFDDGQILVCETAADKDERAPSSFKRLVAHASAIHDTAFGRESSQLFSASADTTLKVWSLDEDLKPAQTKQNVLPEMVFTSAMRWLRDGRRIVSAQATDQPMLRLWDRATGKRLQTCPVPQGLYVTDLCIVSERHIAFVAYAWPSSRSAAVAGIWDLVNNDVRTVYASLGKTSHVSVSSDQKYLIAGIGNEVVFIDIPTEVVAYRQATNTNAPLASHPDRSLCAFANESLNLIGLREDVYQGRRNVVIWDIDQRNIVASLPCDEAITSIAFSPDGRQLAAGTTRGAILLWTNWEAMQNSERKPDPRKLVGHSMHVWDLEFSADSRRIASAALDRTVRLWNASTGNELMQIRTEAEWNYVVTFSPDGSSLAYTGGKGSPFGAIHIVDPKEESR